MPTRRLRWTLPLLLVALFPGRSGAQATANTLLPGDEVRVHAPSVRSSRVRGTVVLYQGSTLDVREQGAVLSIPITSIRELSRNIGIDRGRSSWLMARFGAFLGGAGGLVAGPLIATSRAPDNFSQVMAAAVVTGTLGGAGLGAMFGAAFPREQWQHFRMPIVPIVSAGEGEMSFGLAGSVEIAR
jgi:hypothetical protein